MPHAAKATKKKVKEPVADESLLGLLAKKPQVATPKKLDYDAVRKASQSGPQGKTYRNPDEFWKDQHKVKEPTTENAWDRLQREKALESAGVGIITKQNSTVDVNKNTPKKNLKAFRL